MNFHGVNYEEYQGDSSRGYRSSMAKVAVLAVLMLVNAYQYAKLFPYHVWQTTLQPGAFHILMIIIKVFPSARTTAEKVHSLRE